VLVDTAGGPAIDGALGVATVLAPTPPTEETTAIDMPRVRFVEELTA
jgi:hypothetical protein